MKKFKLFNAIQISLFILICFYLIIKLTFGNKGIFDYYKLDESFKSNTATLNFLQRENKKLIIKTELLNEKTVNSLYLEELARTSLEFGKDNEKFIILE